MTFHDYLRILRERWMVVLAAVLIGLGTTGALFLLRPPEYTAKLTMYISAQTGDTGNAAYQGSLLSQQRVTSYTQLVGSTRVSREVIRRLNLTGSAEDLAGHISAMSPPGSVLLDVSVVERSPQLAAQVANTVGEVFAGLVDELERPTTSDGVRAVAVRVVQSAPVPTVPSSIGLPVTLTLGLLAGLAVGGGAALVRDALDTSVRSPEHLRSAAGAPNLGTIAYDVQVPSSPLILHDGPRSPRSEAFRQLRTNLRFVNVDHACKVVVVTSAMPDEGKTTTLLNLAIALASAGHRVLLIDANLRRPKVPEILGLEQSVGLTSILAGRVRTAQAIQPWQPGRFDVLPGGPPPPDPSEVLSSAHMQALLAALRKLYDVILIDSPPLLPVIDAAAVAPKTDGVLLVCRYKQTTRAQVSAAAEALRAVSAPLLGTVFSMVPRSGSRAARHRTHRAGGRTGDEQPVPSTGTPSDARHAGDQPISGPTGQAPPPSPRLTVTYAQAPEGAR